MSASAPLSMPDFSTDWSGRKMRKYILSYNPCDRDFTVKRPKAPGSAEACRQGVKTCKAGMGPDLQECPDVACADCVIEE